jgi:hypothetical protein
MVLHRQKNTNKAVELVVKQMDRNFKLEGNASLPCSDLGSAHDPS